MGFRQQKTDRTLYWVEDTTDIRNGYLRLIDQRKLPATLVHLDCKTVQQVHDAIKIMAVRGAPAIGAAGGFGLSIAALKSDATDVQQLVQHLEAAKESLDAARPTAVNLSWATDRLVAFAKTMADHKDKQFTVDAIKKTVLREAMELAEQDVEINAAMAKHGAEVVPHGANILHHCNTGALATVDIGTAIGVIYECNHQKKDIHVWVDETRPRLQGARLSAWELMRQNVPLHLIADNAAGLLMLQGKVDIVLYGADRVAANGDTVNKIGTYKLSVVARENGIPVYPVVPTSTIDLSMANGSEIPIEERNDEEVTTVYGVRVAPEGVPVYNPAFDITPSKYITGIITEEGICYPPFNKSLRAAKLKAEARAKKTFEERVEAVLNA